MFLVLVWFVFWGLLCGWCLFASACVCLLLTLSRSSQFDQRLVVGDRHSCHGALGVGSKKTKELVRVTVWMVLPPQIVLRLAIDPQIHSSKERGGCHSFACSHIGSERWAEIACFFLIRCRARHDSCDGRLLRIVGQTSQISMDVRSKQTTNTKTPPKNQKQNKTQNNPPRNSRSSGGETVKRETYGCRNSEPFSYVLQQQIVFLFHQLTHHEALLHTSDPQ